MNAVTSKACVKRFFWVSVVGGVEGEEGKRKGSCLSSHVNPCFPLAERKLNDLDFWSSGCLNYSSAMV